VAAYKTSSFAACWLLGKSLYAFYTFYTFYRGDPFGEATDRSVYSLYRETPLLKRL